MDINGDGYNDILTGSYIPADIYVFYGKNDGTFEPRTELKDTAGNNLNPDKPQINSKVKKVTSVPFAFDWDSDGDLDIIAGNIDGDVILLRNEGTKTKPVFSADKPRLTAAGKDIKAAHGKAGPVVVDWDTDGLHDLIVGADDGSVTFYKNIGTNNKPELAAGTTLIPTGVDYSNLLGPPTPTRSAMRPKLCVVDYNNDGLLDLLVGDFSFNEIVLTAKEEQRCNKLNARKTEITQFAQDVVNEVIDKYGAENLQDLESKVSESVKQELAKLKLELVKISSELYLLEESVPEHGWVWLYLRKSDL